MYSEVFTCIEIRKRVIMRFDSFSRCNRYMTPKKVRYRLQRFVLVEECDGRQRWATGMGDGFGPGGV